MIIKRTIEIEADPSAKGKEQFQVGDVIAFTLIDGEEVEAMAMKHEEDGMIFALVDCLKDEAPMVKDGKPYMQDYLNKEVYNRFPEEIGSLLIPFENGDMLRLMTQKEVFGYNYADAEDETESVEQFEPMKIRRNRIADIGKGSDEWGWYWLANPTWLRVVARATHFAYVTGYGFSYAYGASNSRGVRPAFKIRDL